jgi:hypothetical protein
MSVTLRVRFPDLTVTSVAGVMREYPYTICPESVDRLERLVGLAVGGGFTRALNERLGRQNGCSHLTALVHAMLPVITQAADSAFHDLTQPPDAGQSQWWLDTCHAWRSDGPLADRIRQGDSAAVTPFLRRPPRLQSPPA